MYLIIAFDYRKKIRVTILVTGLDLMVIYETKKILIKTIWGIQKIENLKVFLDNGKVKVSPRRGGLDYPQR